MGKYSRDTPTNQRNRVMSVYASVRLWEALTRLGDVTGTTRNQVARSYLEEFAPHLELLAEAHELARQGKTDEARRKIAGVVMGGFDEARQVGLFDDK